MGQSTLVNRIISKYSVIIWDYTGNAFFFPAHQISLSFSSHSKTYLCFTSKSLEQQIHKPQCLTYALCVMYHVIEKGVILGSCLEFLVLSSTVRQAGAFRQVLCEEAEEVYRMSSNENIFLAALSGFGVCLAREHVPCAKPPGFHSVCILARLALDRLGHQKHRFGPPHCRRAIFCPETF